MRIAFAALVLAAAVPASAQQPRLGARTQAPDRMLQALSPASPEEELAALIAEADRHPLGTARNPIRVGGPDGERAYLSHLRCAEGGVPRVGTRREGGIGGFGSVVGAYRVSCGAGEAELAFDIYHEEHRETRAPAGFSYAP